MLSVNHAMSGILIASVAPLPIAIPAAFLSHFSHFAMDYIPHYGMPRQQRDKSRFHRTLIQGDAVLALCLNIPALVYISWLPGAYHAWNMQICGWVAASPDFSLVYYYLTHGRTLNTYHNGLLRKLHLDFHYERPWLIAPELLITITLMVLIFHQLGR